jgi:hypothetical protein
MEEVVVSDEPAVVCPHCGHQRPVLRLPLFQVTGASAAGKSRVCRDLPAALPECVVLDQDILLSGLPSEQHRRNWLRVAMNIHQGGRSTVLIATQLPEHYEQLPERAWFSEIHYLALVCDGEEIGERLRQRPAWRGVTAEQIAEMQDFNEWLQANAATTSPPMMLLDTTEAQPAETVAAVAAWVRQRLPTRRRTAVEARPFVLGRRTRNLPAPPAVVWESLSVPRRPGARPWLNLLPDEIEPSILETSRPNLVVWSSIWPKTPDQEIRFEIASDGSYGTNLTWELHSPVEMDASAVGHRRFRLNRLLWADLRYSYGQ